MNHGHSEAGMSLPVAAEVFTRDSEAGGDSIETATPKPAGRRSISDSDSAVLGTKSARSPVVLLTYSS